MLPNSENASLLPSGDHAGSIAPRVTDSHSEAVTSSGRNRRTTSAAAMRTATPGTVRERISRSLHRQRPEQLRTPSPHLVVRIAAGLPQRLRREIGDENLFAHGRRVRTGDDF